MLNALNSLSGVAVDTVTKSRDQLVANLKALQPTLNKLGEAGPNLPNALQILLTYPFPDYAGNVIKGDYANVEANVNLDLDTLIQNFTNSSQPPIALPSGQPSAVAPPLPLPDLGSGPQSAGPNLLGGLLGLIGGGR